MSAVAGVVARFGLIALLALALGALLLFSANPAGAQSKTDYDTDGDNLIEIATLDELNAVGYDLDGNGVADDVSDQGAVIRNLAMVDVDVDRAGAENKNDFGAIAGINRGRIERSSSTGAVKGLRKVGGLAGRNFGTVINSYSTVTVTGAVEVGGLVGYNEGSTSAITSSFYAGNLLNPQLHYRLSGPGLSISVNAIDAGGVAGKNDGTITASYFDKDIGFSSSDSTAQTTVALQTPTGATGIYSTWDANIWDFGTSSEYPSLKPPAQAVDYDDDNDNLIEVSTLDQLNAIRWDLDGNGAPDAANANDYALAFPNAATGMGCPITAADADDNDCTGYELDADLDFNTDTGSDSGGAAVIDADDDYYNGGDGWEPLGDSGPNPFRTTFEGNNHTISNLFINVAGNSDNYIGLFGQLGGATVTRVHLVDAKVTGNNDVGALVGHITLGTVSHSSSSGTVSGVGKVGGLVGAINSSSGVVEYSRSSAVVTATGKNVGGLVGYSGGTVRVSYATGAVTGLDDVGGLAGYSPTSLYAVYATGAVTATGSSNAQAGGLVGASEGGIYASYSTGAVTSASGHAGGLLNPSGSGATVGHSYWDVTTTGIADDNNADTGVGKTTRDLQMPTQTDGYAGIYANWNLNLDGDASTDDDPWDFGTASQYPALKADEDGDGRATAYEFGRQGRSAPVVDYDLDDDGLIEVADLDQLNAMRWDLDGDGAPDVANANDYALAFPNPATGMGCPITATDADDNDCTGYELDANLDFNTDTGSDSGGAAVIDAADDYYNSGSGWEPIGDDSSGRNTWYNAIFEGNGHTISNLFISRAHRWVGLFGISSEAGFFRNVGLVDVNVTGWGYTGALIGHAYGTVDAAYSTGIVVSNKLTHVGGLVGHLSENGSIQRSYSTASVTGFGTRLGGLVGTNRGPIRASYATGAVAGSSIHSNRIGGLVGESGGDITASYATGSVTGAGSDKGGLIGELNKGTITNSYWDVTSSGIADDSDATTGVGKTTLQLQSPAQTDGYAGIYADWDIDVDNADVDDDTTTETDDPWDFGTASEYPALKVEWDGDGTPTAYEFGRQGRSAPGVGPPANGPPVFTPGYDDTPNIAEGVTAVGTYAATDPEGDQLTYAVTGTDASDFAISGAGALTLASASNHETKESYSVNVTVHDGKNAAGGADTTVDLTLAITVTVDDTLEPPTVPTSLGVVPAANGLTVTWTAPVMPSTKPALDDYDVQHSLRTSAAGDPATWGAWVAFDHVGTGTTATITGLVAGSTYQVQVMAKNNEGESAWTAAVTGVPAAAVDYDLDDDGLIEVGSLTKLNAIRWDLDGDGAPASASAAGYAAVFPYPEAGMGCPDTDSDAATPNCTGYELTADLDFDQNNDNAITSADAAWWNSGAGWAPIGNWDAPFNATFDGGGHTVSHMYIRVGGGDVGLFGSTDTSSVIRNLGMVSPSIDRTGSLALDSAAAVAGSNRGTIDSVFVTGGSIWAYAKIGGVAGHNRGTVSNSYSRMTVTGNTQVGGLVGWNETASGIITNSYAAGGVATHGEAGTRGGVSGTNAAADFGGLVGKNNNSATVTAGYWDTEASGQAASAAGAAQTTAGLQSPTGATGIYSAWGTVKWDFGTASQYPALKYDTDGVGGATWQEFGGQVRIAPVDYDTDNDGLIEVDSLAKLNAIRYDLNGDGGVTPADKASYDTAFPNAQGSMGCLNSACAGYELTDDLNFDQNNDNAITSADAAWWNSGAGWAPIGDWANPFNATFDGRGHTISNLYIRIGGGDVGLFGSTDTSSVIRNLGMVNPSIDRTGALTLDSAAAVAGSNRGAIQRVFVSGGSIWAFSKTGGLVGHNRGAISDSYSRMAVTGNTQVGGLVGWNENASGTITNSYAMGKVATHGLTGTPPGGGSRQNPIADVGGLVGKNDGGATVTAGYWDTEASRQSASAGGAGAVGQTTAGLQSPTGATGIYLTWAAATWDFGTASQYPALKYDTNGIGGATWQEFGSQARAAPPPPTDYDTDDDGLIEVDSLAQLNAIRYDLDGNGAVTAANQASFDHAFPNAAASMGCAGNACTGYELTDDLDFDTDDDGTVDGSDDYPSWGAIGAWATPFTATFDGGGHTISNMKIRAAIGDQGLFGSVNSPGVLRNVAVLNVDIDRTGSPTFRSIGGLLGSNRGAVEGSYATGAVTGFENVGGLVGDNRGAVTNSYSSVTVTGNKAVGGLVGFNRNSAASITNSYAVGAVSAVAMLASGGNSVARTKGGLVGEATADATVTAGYWDTTTSGQAASAGGAGAVSQTTAGLQSPTSAAGIYSTWAAAVWDFGTGSQYPALKYDTDGVGGATAYEFGRQGRSAPVVSVNGPPTFDAGADATPNIAEGATAVGTYAATDPDSDTLTYAVIGTDASEFAISGLGVLTLSSAANHETQSSFSISVTVHDGKNAAGGVDTTVDLTLAITVTVDDTLEPPTAPTNLQVFPEVEGLRVTWTAPVMPSTKPPLDDYDVQHSVRTSGDGVNPVTWGAWLAFDHVGTGTTATITGLTPGSTYRVQVMAKNNEGDSPGTAAVTGVPLAQSTGVDYDGNDDGLIEVDSLAKLNAMRWDPDGDGAPIAANADDYALAFPTPVTGMGCPDTDSDAATSNCLGYELTADLDFDTNGSGTANSGDTYWNTGAGWTPIGDHPNGTGADGYTAVFEGNGHTVANLFINQPAVDRMGLFGTVGETGVLRNLAVVDADVTGKRMVGTLAGYVWGTVKLSYATGSVHAAISTAGGLVGVTKPTSLVSQSYAAVDASATLDEVKAQVQTVGTYVGGLVGQLQGRVEVSYATGSVSGQQGVGGLVGWFVTGAVEASYSTGRVQGNDRQGGLVGNATTSMSAGTVTNSYWDTRTSGQTSSAGGTGKTTIELMTPTAYGSGSDIYANWNLDLDGDTNSDDDPWDFGTASEYPALKADWDGNSATAAEFGSQARTAPIFADGTSTTVAVVESAPANQDIPGSPAARGPAAGDTLTYALSGTDAGHFDIDAGSGQLKTRGALERAVKTSYSVVVTATYGSGASDSITVTINVAVDYDTDSDGLIEVSSLDQLDAIRRDLDGDGGSTYASYARAFLDMAVGMGCPDTDSDADTSNCLGYELMRNLDFDTHGDDDAVTDADTWWNDGDGWHPLGGAVVRGAANPKYEAIFEGNGFTISNMLINLPNRQGVGLFGALDTDGVIRNLGLVNATVTARSVVGPLAGLVAGTVESSYATGSVTGSGNNVGGLVGSVPAGGRVLRSYTTASVSSSGTSVGGLAGFLGGTIKASYAAGNISGSGASVGGLVGEVNRGTVTASYARGEVQGANLVGGLVGRRRGSATVTDSYWDTETSGQGSSVRGVGKTTSELRTPAQTDGYAGIYANWNIDLDGQAGGDDPWDFGTGSEYPALKVEWDGDNTPSAYEFGRQGRSAPAVANGAPTFGVVGPYTPDENQTAVGTIPVATDPDAGATLTYEMMMGAGDGDHALFTFVPGTRVLTFKTAPNFENPPLSKTTYTVKIRVRDSLNAGGTADTGWDDTVTVTINLQNVNEAPTFGVVGPFTPDENQTAVVTLPANAAVDPDAGATLTYQMMEGASDGDHALFTFVPGTRVLTFKTAPNFENPPLSKTTYTVKIRVRDSLNAGGTADTGWDDTVTVTINLQDVNEAPTFGVVGPYTPDENQTAVGTIPVATDPDAGATLTYEMMMGAGDGDHALFTFVPGTRVLTFKTAPNFENPPLSKTTYTVKIRVRDSLNAGGTADTGWDDTVTVTINLQNVNEAPTFGVVGPFTPDENQTAVVTLPANAAVDPDAGATLTYQMMEGASDGDHALFTFVPGTRVLTFKTAPNFENPPLSKTTYTVKIRVRDSLNAGGTADTGWDDTVTVTINLQNVNEAPTFGVVGPFTPDENQTAVGTIPVATDPDAGATLTYEMMMGAGDGDHALFTFVPGTRVLTFKTAPNFENPPLSKTTYTVKIRVRDSLNAGGTADTGWDDTVTVTINLQNVNEAPTFGVVGPFTPDENQTAVVTLPANAAVDPDAGATLTYQMMEGASDGDHALFTFVPGTRVLTFKTAPNFENPPLSKTTYTVKIRVRDSLNAGGTADTGWDDTVTVTINLQDVNEAPTFGVVGPYTPDENQTAVGTIPVATDPDAGATLTYEMMMGAGDGDHALFTFVPGTRVLTFKTAPNFENPPLSKTTYTVKIRVRDSLNAGGTADTGWDDTVTVTINLQDVNEEPEFMSAATTDVDGNLVPAAPIATDTRSFREDAAADAAIGAPVAATDPDTEVDPLDTLTYALAASGDHASFAIDTATGQLKTKAGVTYDYEAKDTYTVTVTVHDGKNAAAAVDATVDDTITVTINVTDALERWTPPTGLNIDVVTLANRIRVTWTAPAAADNTGKPALTGYKVEWRQKRTASAAWAPDWVDFPRTGLGVMNDITTYTVTATDGTTTTYTVATGGGRIFEVRVCSLNTDGAKSTDSPKAEQCGSWNGNALPAFTEGTKASRSVAENTPANTNIGNPIAAADSDATDTLAYSITVGTHSGKFTIDSATGQLKTKDPLDHETAGSYDVYVKVNDGNNGIDGIMVTITVTDVNEPPAFDDGAGPTTRSVSEGAAAGDAIGDPVEATDPDTKADPLDTLTYALDTTTGDHANFEIDTGTGQLKVKDALDYETKSSYTVTVQVRDSLSAAGVADTVWDDTIVVNISVGDVNEAPVFTAGAGPLNRSVAENAGANANVGLPVPATDVDDGDSVTLSMSGTGANLFSISSTGQIKAKASLDYETAVSYAITVTATDTSSATDTILVNISVTDVDEPPTAPTGVEAGGIANGLRVTWTAPVMTNKPTLDGYDVEYSLRTAVAVGATPVTWGAAVITDAGLVLTHDITGLTPDSTYRVRVRAKNAEGISGWSSYDTGVPTMPPLVNADPTFGEGADTTRSVAENTAAGTAIGNPIAATDTDASDTLVYAIDATTGDHGHFAIDSTNGQLKVKSALDYESNNRYTVVVTVSDGNGGTDSITVTIDVDDVVNEAPVVVPPQANVAPSFDEGASASRNVAENTPAGRNIGSSVGATDHDNDVLRYELEATGDHGHFAIDSSSGQLKTKGALDYESKSSYAVTVIVWDGNGGTDSIPVTIRVTNVDDTPTVTPTPVAPTGTLAFDKVGVARRTVDAYAPVGTAVGAPITATVSAGMAGPFYSVYTRSSPFIVDRLTGQLRTARKLGPADEYTIQLLATDGKGRLDVIGVIITVTGGRANRDPVFREGASATRSVVAGSSRGVRVGRPVTATDPDGDALFYMVSGTDSSHFSIGSGSGQIKVGRPLTKSSYSFEVVVGDLKGGVDVLDITITVTAVDAPPVATTPTPTPNRAPSFDEGAGASRSVAENTPAGRNIGLPLAATDPDSDSLTYALGGTDSGHFVLSGNRLRTSGALDYEGVKNSYAVTVTVSDGRGGTDTIDVTITVTNVNEAPVVAPPPANRAPSFDEGASASRSVAENTPAGRNIGLPLAATDPDSDSLTYALGGTDSGHFVLSGNRLRTSGALDYEGVKNSYAVTVTVSDGRGGTDTIDVTITVTNVNEAPVVAPPPANRAPSFDEGASASRSVAENTPAGTDIGLPLAATDPDGDSLTYALSGADSGHFALSGNRLQTSGALDYEGQNSYSVTVNVSDGNGGSDTTAVTITVTNVNEAPGALPGLAVFEEVNGIRVSWSAPDMTGKPPITGYDVQYKLVTATDWNDHSHSGTGTTIQGLTAGSTYNVRVRAKNDEGNSVWARAQTTPTAPPVTPVPPGAITNLEVTPGWSKLGLTWNMPDMTGKPPITHYEVQYKLSIDKYWGDFPHDSTVRRVTIDFLGGGLSYDVRVRAVNSAGNSDWVSSSGTTK